MLDRGGLASYPGRTEPSLQDPAVTAPVPSLPDLLRSQGGRLLGWSCLADVALAGLMARAGFDVVLLDQQHGTYDVATCTAGLTELALWGKPGLVRIAVGDFAMASKMLDGGAAGIVAPMINTVEDARALAAATKFRPPASAAGGLTGRCGSPASRNPQDYLTQAQRRTMTIAMCETREAIANLPEILRVPGIDGHPRRPRRPVHRPVERRRLRSERQRRDGGSAGDRPRHPRGGQDPLRLRRRPGPRPRDAGDGLQARLHRLRRAARGRGVHAALAEARGGDPGGIGWP